MCVWRLSVSIVILCVDDDPTALTVRRLLLSIAGYEVLTAESGETALQLFNGNQVDLVLTDHLLPDISGAALSFQMKRLKPEVAVVLLTASAEFPPGYDHADLLLNKGLTPEDFLAKIAGLVSARESSRNNGGDTQGS